MAGSAQAAPATATTKGLTNTSGTSASQMSSTTGGQTSAQQEVSIPEWLKPFVQQATGVAGSSLMNLQNQVGGFQLDPTAMNALQSTAGGDFLYGSQPGQQAFIDAGVRAAQAPIYSQFGAAGRAGSGLEAAALDQAALDKYAQLYQGERSNQLAAANAIPGFQLLPLQLQQQLATLAGGLPGQFSPFLGNIAQGTTNSTTHGYTTGQTTGSEMTKGTQQTPMYQDTTPDWLKYGVAGLGILGAPATGGASLGLLGSVV